MTQPNHRNALKSGYELREYRIEKVLGQGGFGITYRARHVKLGLEVAIKEYLPTEWAVREPDFSVQPSADSHDKWFKWGLERFIEEAQTLTRFKKHPNIVRVLDLFEANGTGYMLMEYEHGETLKDLLDRWPGLKEDELLNIVLPILDGLETVHEHGFIHRDIKPANIFIRVDGSPVLIDFGSARQDLVGHSRTLTSLVSQGYTPHEQYDGKGKQQGAWTDIYSLGATLYRAVAGTPPPDAPARTNAILDSTPDPMEDIREIGKGRYSANFLEAIDHALRLRLKERPQSVAEWRREFGAGQEITRRVDKPRGHSDDTEVITKRSEGPAPPRPSPVKRRPLLGLMLVILVLAAGGVSLFVYIDWTAILPETAATPNLTPGDAESSQAAKNREAALGAVDAALERDDAQATVLVRIKEARDAGVEPAVLNERRGRLRERIEERAAGAAADMDKAMVKKDTAGARKALQRYKSLEAEAAAVGSEVP